MIGRLGQMNHGLGPLQGLDFERMGRIGLQGRQPVDMKEIGLHPEDLFENIVEFDYRTTLLDI
jgi:hypothetical protein